MKYKKIYSVEIQEYFASLISRNARLNKLEGSIIPMYRDIRELTKDDVGGECDSVVSNPPYMKAESGKQNDATEMNTARREENGGIDEFCSCAARLLKFGGYFTVVYRPERMAELFYSMKQSGIEPKESRHAVPVRQVKAVPHLNRGQERRI